MNVRFDRSREIAYLLQTALTSTEEYIYEGEMSYYPRRYADDAASDLDMKFRSMPPDETEMEIILSELLVTERIENGRSLGLLLRLREQSRPILHALTRHTNCSVRLFGLRACKTSLPGYHSAPLYGSIDIEMRLLDDADDAVRLAAVEAVGETLRRNADYLNAQLSKNVDCPMIELHRSLQRRLDDPSPSVREAAIAALEFRS